MPPGVKNAWAGARRSQSFPTAAPAAEQPAGAKAAWTSEEPPASDKGCPKKDSHSSSWRRKAKRWRMSAASLLNWKKSGAVGAAAGAAPEDVDPVEAVRRQADALIAEMEERLAQTKYASSSERKKVFRDLQRRYHPDKNTESCDVAKLVFQRLMDNQRSYLKG